MNGSGSGHESIVEYKAILDHSGIAVVCTRNRRVCRCNPRAEELFGWARGELVGQPDRVFFADDESREALRQRALAALRNGQILDSEVEMIRRDRSRFVAQLIARAIDPSAPRLGTVWMVRDVTAEVAARESNVRLLREQTLIFERAPIGIAFLRGRIIQRCNPSFERMFGHPTGELVGRSTRVCFASDEAWEDAGARAYAAVASSGKFVGELPYCRADGTPIWCQVTGSLLDPGRPAEGYVWLFEDVTARRAAEEALRESHLELERRVAERTVELSRQLDFMRQLVEAIPGPVFYKDRQGRYLGCNQAFLEMIGRRREQVIGATVHDLAPPDLAARYQAADDALFSRTGSQVYEAKVAHADGTVRDAVVHRATYGKPDEPGSGLIGVILDITERKRMEARLEQAATVFDSSAEGITITAPDGSIIAVNRAFSEITGYREEEVVGRNSRMLQSGRHDRAFYDEMWNTLRSRGRWQGEIWNRRKDGRHFLEFLTVSAVRDRGGEVTHYVGVFSDITELRRAHDLLAYQAHHDPLTGLPNRLLLGDRLHKALQRAHRDGKQLAVLFIDLDRFKNINDTLGHQAGDQVLCEVARRLSRLMRESDTVGRLGGDEFLILAEDIGGPGAVSHVAEKIMNALQSSPVTVGQEFFVGASIGISVFPQDGGDGETLMKNADVAMYRAKERGRNAYEFFTRELTRTSLARLQMETDLRRAIERNELRVFLQPQFSLASGRLVGAEALVRWLRTDGGLVLPGEFVRLAEESGLIVPIGEWVQLTASRQWAEWLAAGLEPGVLSINVSGVEFARGNIRHVAKGTLLATGLPARFLELEITESAIMSHAGSGLGVLDELRALGLGLAIDDFGTGYSSLAYLKRLPLNKLKIDQSFVRGLPGDLDDAAITRAVIALAHSLQLTVIAEGVETEAQRAFLSGEGCDEMQGYLCGRPMPIDEYRERFLSV